ncbi:MAG TPA: AraC family transcriptional regulator [Candidatus Dormibacteraeota bacterium]|nr:AraC family transcriptional regulator [Candidatus Dormibacteraeota bacterium]
MTAEFEEMETDSDSWREALLDDLLGSIRVRSSIFLRAALDAPWGVTVDARTYGDALLQFRRVKSTSPPRERSFGSQRACFHIVAAGSCWLQMASVPGPIRLAAGDFVVFPQADLHVMRDAPITRTQSLLDLLRASPPSSNGEVRLGGGGVSTRIVCGGMRFDHVKTNPLLAALPPLIHVKGSEDGGAPWLRLTVQHLVDELDSDRTGVEAVVSRLADILFIGAVRRYIEECLASAESGWLAAVRDHQIGRAIALVHSDPARPWTVAALADEVASSRSAFASKFTRLVGEPPLRYLTRVRLGVAARRLRDTNDKLLVVAAAAGYDSAAAFTRAFERYLGVTPGEYRRAHSGSCVGQAPESLDDRQSMRASQAITSQ